MSNKTKSRKKSTYVLIVAGRHAWYGPRWECLRKAKGYSAATKPHVANATVQPST